MSSIEAANTKISALGKLLNPLEERKTSLEGIKIESLKIMKAEVSDEGILTATASSSATEGLYSVKVNRTAKSHTLYSRIYPAENSVVGTGMLAIQDTYRTPISKYLKAEKTTYTSFNR